MNTTDMREILKHLLDQHRDPDPTVYSHIPSYIQTMGEALQRIEYYESLIPAVETLVAQAEAVITALETDYPFLLNRAPLKWERIGIDRNGKDILIPRRNHRADMPRPQTMSAEMYSNMRIHYFRALNDRQQHQSRLAQYQQWLAEANQQWRDAEKPKPTITILDKT